MRALRVSQRRTLPARLLSFRATRSAGPGGQNVNKVATRVELTLDLRGAERVIGPDAVARIRRAHPRRLDAGGDLRVVCGRTRSRARNLELACDRMEELVAAALVRPRRRRATRPTAASRTRRIESKRRRGTTKRLRGAPPADD